MTNPDMNSISWLRVVFAFAVLAALLVAFGLTLKYARSRMLGVPVRTNGGRRMHVVETLLLDARRRLVIVRCDETEHLLLLGANEDIVVKTNLSAPSQGFEKK